MIAGGISNLIMSLMMWHGLTNDSRWHMHPHNEFNHVTWTLWQQYEMYHLMVTLMLCHESRTMTSIIHHWLYTLEMTLNDMWHGRHRETLHNIEITLKLPSLFAAWRFWNFHNKSHNIKALVILSHSWSPFLPLICLHGKNELLWVSVLPSGVFSWEQTPLD